MVLYGMLYIIVYRVISYCTLYCYVMLCDLLQCYDAAIDARWRCRFCREHLLLQGAKATWQPQRNGSKDLPCLLKKKHYLYTYYIYM